MAKVSIRQFRDDDVFNLVKYGNNKKIWDNMRDYFPNPYQHQDGVSFIEMINGKEPITTFAIDYQGELIGVIGYNLQTDIYHHSAEIGYWIGEPFWGKGIVSEAIKLTIDHAFNVMDIKRLYTSVFGFNIGSIKVLEKSGFTFEGKGLKAVCKNGAYYDDMRYSLLNPKYFES